MGRTGCTTRGDANDMDIDLQLARASQQSGCRLTHEPNHVRPTFLSIVASMPWWMAEFNLSFKSYFVVWLPGGEGREVGMSASDVEQEPFFQGSRPAFFVSVRKTGPGRLVCSEPRHGRPSRHLAKCRPTPAI